MNRKIFRRTIRKWIRLEHKLKQQEKATEKFSILILFRLVLQSFYLDAGCWFTSRHFLHSIKLSSTTKRIFRAPIFKHSTLFLASKIAFYLIKCEQKAKNQWVFDYEPEREKEKLNLHLKLHNKSHITVHFPTFSLSCTQLKAQPPYTHSHWLL